MQQLSIQMAINPNQSNRYLSLFFDQRSHIAPLVIFRFLFGALMIFSILRFWSKGWIESLYLNPQFHFTYWGFEWVQPIGLYTYGIFVICLLASIGVMLGFFYRLSIVSFFLSFTYIELMDKTTYLNHYYAVSLLAFILIFLPAAHYFSLDAWRSKKKRSEWIPAWSIVAIKLMLCIVYFYAGLAKLNSDWLIEAQPLKIWLSVKYDFPILGRFMNKDWMHYAFSWGGALFDLSIPFLLWFRKTRIWAYIAVVAFHLMTRFLFPIGVFPYVMIASTLIFFESGFHQKIIQTLSRFFRLRKIDYAVIRDRSYSKWPVVVLSIFFIVQLFLPFRYLSHPGELFWHEQGYRFSWRVMLMEKAGWAQFKVVDTASGKKYLVDNYDHLTAFQEKQMATQPDFIIEYAHYLAGYYKENMKVENPAVYVESRVTLNGRPSQTFIDPNVDLTQVQDNFNERTFVLPFKDKIYGF